MTNITLNKTLKSTTASNHKTVFKFGGSSLANAAAFERVGQIIINQLNPDDLVVVSASGNTTDWLQSIVNNKQRTSEYLTRFREHHQDLIKACTKTDQHTKLLQELKQNCQWLAQLIALNQTQANANDILALGEIWSAKLLCHLLEAKKLPASWLDARLCIKLNWQQEDYELDELNSKKRLADLLLSRTDRVTVITGFIASDCESNTLTLGRNSSDYSAAIVARLVSAKSLTLWTDVAGIYNFDPNLTTAANSISELSFTTVEELSFLGSPVVHLKTLKPLYGTEIKLNIRSSFSPELKGTQVSQSQQINPETIVSHSNHLICFSVSCSGKSATQKLIQQLEETAHRAKGNISSEFYLLTKRRESSFEWITEQKDQVFWYDFLKNCQIDLEITSTIQCSLLTLINEGVSSNSLLRSFFNDFIQYQPNTQLVIQKTNACIAIFNQPNIDNIALSFFDHWHSTQNSALVTQSSKSNASLFDARVKETAKPILNHLALPQTNSINGQLP